MKKKLLKIVVLGLAILGTLSLPLTPFIPSVSAAIWVPSEGLYASESLDQIPSWYLRHLQAGLTNDGLLWSELSSDEKTQVTNELTRRTTGSSAVTAEASGNLVFDVGTAGGSIIIGRASASNGTALTCVSGKCTVLRDIQIGPFHQTTLTLTLTGANDLDLADGDHGTGVQIADFPEGRIFIIGATTDLTVVHNGAFNASTNDVFNVAMGTAVGADDNDLTSTEADIIPKTVLDTASGATLSLAFDAALATGAQFDGTATAKDIFMNVACAATSNSGATTYAVTGTLTVTWMHLGDY